MTYNMKGGLNYTDITGNREGMSTAEREWFILRLDKQVKKENAAMTAAKAKAGKKGKK